MELEIFTWNHWDQLDTMGFSFYDCVFIKDFGPWKAGHKANTMFVDYAKGIIKEYSEDGTRLVNKVQITLAIKE